MDALLRKLTISLIRDSLPSAARRRPATKPSLSCDALEGRQLLATGFSGGGMGAMHARGHGMAGEVRGMAWDHRNLGDDWGSAASAIPATPSTTPTSATDTASTTATTTSTSTTTATTPTPTTPPTPLDNGRMPTLTTQAKTDLQTLRTDTQTIQNGSSVTQGELSTFRQDENSLRQDATTAPSQAAVTALQTDLSALQGTLPTAAQTTQLETDYTTLLTSEGITDTSLIQKSIADQVAIAASSNVTQAELNTISADQKAVATDLGLTVPTTPPTSGAPAMHGGMDGNLNILGGLTGGALGGPGGTLGGPGFGGPGGRFGV